MNERGVLTIACGKQIYLDMASALARSFRVWHGDDDLTLNIATDAPERFPSDVQSDPNVSLLDISEKDFGEGFENKLYIDELLPARRSLFIDADCLLTGPLDPVFEVFDGRSVSVVGGEMSEGEWFGDLKARCERFGVPSVPVFMGALYYVENDETAQRVFERARNLRHRYDETGFVRLRGLPNEEPLISVGMAHQGEKPVPDDGMIKADAIHFDKKMHIDVLKGESYFRGNSTRATAWNVREAEPVIAHFNDSYAEKLPYIREKAKLKKVFADDASKLWASVHTGLTRSLPFSLKESTKDLLRPMYHALWGPREIHNERVE